MGTQVFVVINFMLCRQAYLNEGIASTIWSLSPLFAAFYDFLIFKHKLSIKHLLGMMCLIGSAIAISISKVV